jgi:hypothetical protein
MASNLYDSGAPQRIIVEHRGEVQRSEPQCPEAPGWTCAEVRQKWNYCQTCPLRPAAARVTIAPEFEVVKEPKRLK